MQGVQTWHSELWLAAVGVQPGNFSAGIEQVIEQQTSKGRLSGAFAAADGSSSMTPQPRARLAHLCTYP